MIQRKACHAVPQRSMTRTLLETGQCGNQQVKHVFIMSGGAVSCASMRHSTVATSSTEAEYIATAFLAKEAVGLRQLLREIKQQFIDPRE
jgi:hypothetical protein